MFTLAFERTQRVLLARFVSILSSEDFVQFDAAVMAFVTREGLVRCLLDLSGVEAVAVPHTFFAGRGRAPVIVAPHLEAYDLARAYASRQREFGNIEPRVVLSMWDAYRLLGLALPDFQPIP
jgi:hypothetical protein